MTDVRMRRKVAKLEKRLSEAEEKIFALKTVAEAEIELSAAHAEDFIAQDLPDYFNRRPRI